MDILKCEENPVTGLPTSSRPHVKTAVNQSVKKSKRALADVGNTIHQSIKTLPNFSKTNEASCKNVNSCSEEINIFDEDLFCAGLEIKVAADLSPCYYYDSEDEDIHDDCSTELLNDDFDCLLPLSIRFNSDDLDSLASFKPSKTPWDNHWDDDLPAVHDDSDLDDFNVPFPSPEEKFFKFSLPFNDFVVPGINLDCSF